MCGEEPGASFEREAAEVAAQLASLRGGGLFLSGADGRLLLRWFEQGVPLGVVLAALDRVAARRARRRSRLPLSLAACRREVERWLEGRRGGDAGRLPSPAPPSGGCAAEEPELRAFRRELRALEARFREQGRDEEALNRLLARARELRERLWERAERGPLLEEAEEELAGLRPELEPETFRLLVEERARERFFRGCPELSAAAIWDRLASP